VISLPVIYQIHSFYSRQKFHYLFHFIVSKDFIISVISLLYFISFLARILLFLSFYSRQRFYHFISLFLSFHYFISFSCLEISLFDYFILFYFIAELQYISLIICNLFIQCKSIYFARYVLFSILEISK